MARTSLGILVSPADQAELEAVIRAHTSPQNSVLRAKIILALKTHQRLDKVAELLGTAINTVKKWRDRYIELGIGGLIDKHRKGRNVTYGAETEKSILEKLGETPPDGCARWDGTLLSRELGIPAGAIWAILRKHGIQLSRMRTWCVSTDPDFDVKAADIIGLYLNPPENAVVICVDEKPSIQALSRTVGYVECHNGKIVQGIKSTYKRNGTVNLFAALEVFTGKIIGEVTKYKKRVDFLNFMDKVIADYPSNETQEFHVILDNYCVHKRCDEWLAAHPNVKFHYTPTSASWLNQVEVWFGIFSRKVVRGSSFNSVEQLTKAINEYIIAYNENNAHPFTWRKREVKGTQIRDTIINLQN